MDDGDIMCHPILVPSCLHEFDDADAKVGAERTAQKTEDDLGAAPPEWKTDDVLKMATVSTVTAGSTGLGVAVGLLARADVTRAMHERVQLSQDRQTEFAVTRRRAAVTRAVLPNPSAGTGPCSSSRRWNWRPRPHRLRD